MKITPIDISYKSFSKRLRGYDIDEVYKFLQEVADALSEVILERNQLKETIRKKEEIITEHKERQEVLKKTITTATRMSEKICEDSEKEAENIIEDARNKARLIVKEVEDSISGYYSEIERLKAIHLKFDTQIRAGVQTHLALLDQMNGFIENESDDKGEVPCVTHSP